MNAGVNMLAYEQNAAELKADLKVTMTRLTAMI
jgi:hypothetical protein